MSVELPTKPAPFELPEEILSRIELLLMDCDGVLTDGRVWVDDSGAQHKAFSVIDGYGLVMLREAGVTLALVTRDPSAIPRHRAEKLGFHHVFGDVTEKGACVRRLLRELGLSSEEAAFVGDDLPDLEAFAEVGLALAPSSARPEVLVEADVVTVAGGGRGAIREICDAILRARRSAGQG